MSSEANSTPEIPPALAKAAAKRAPRIREGRPTKLSPELIATIVSYVRMGSYIETAAIAAGVSKQTYFTWFKDANDIRENIKKAELGGGRQRIGSKQRLLLQFLDAIEKAVAEADLSDVVTIKKASVKSWQAAAWRLERKNPDKWGQRNFVKAEHSGPNGAPIQTETTDTTGMTDIEKDDLLKRHYERIQRNRPADAPA